MGPAEVRAYCPLDPAGKSLLRAATPALAVRRKCAAAPHVRAGLRRLGTVARILKLARTIADLAGERTVEPAQVAEALRYRPRIGAGG